MKRFHEETRMCSELDGFASTCKVRSLVALWLRRRRSGKLTCLHAWGYVWQALTDLSDVAGTSRALVSEK